MKWLLIVLLGLMMTGCALFGINSEVDRLKNDNETLQKKLEKAAEDYNILKTYASKFMEIDNAAKSLNYRILKIIRFVVDSFGELLKNLFFDWIWFAAWIAALTELLGFLKFLPPTKFLFKALAWIFKTSKLWTSLLIATPIAILLGKWIYGGDWLYFVGINILSWILANVAWEFLLNKTGISARVKIKDAFKRIPKAIMA